jgi:hypothetical protein
VGDQYDDVPDLRLVLAVVGAAVMLLAGSITVAVLWKSSLYYAVLPFGVLAVIIGLQIALVFLPAAPAPARTATPAPPVRPADEFDSTSRVLMRRAQSAIRAVLSSEVCRAGLLDRAAVSTTLASQESDIAAALREQAWLRARRAELTPAGAGPMTTAVSASQIEAEQKARSSIAARVETLERYAAEVRAADAAYRDWRQATRLAELQGQHLDLLARTAADDHGSAEVEAMTLQARAVTLALRQPE